MKLIVIICFFFIAAIVQILYWCFFIRQFRKLASPPSARKANTKNISIVICLKNESENLIANFDSWVCQVTANDELILVDDFSTDDTAAVAADLAAAVENCHFISCTKERAGKKQALIDGVAAASKSFILVTDADCKPESGWKSRMTQSIQPTTEFVLGFAPFFRREGFLNRFQRFEGLLTAIQYFSYASAGAPYMGVGRNMLFSRKVFDPKIYHSNLASGDDDLLVSARATKENTDICIDPETFVYSEAPITIQQYWRQKVRHISSSTEYKTYIKLVLALFSSSQILANILLIPMLFTCCWPLALLFMIARLLSIYVCLKRSGKMLKQEDLAIFTLVLDLSLTLYYLILAISFPFKKKTTWN